MVRFKKYRVVYVWNKRISVAMGMTMGINLSTKDEDEGMCPCAFNA